MKLDGQSISKTFLVKHKEKTYCINYFYSDYGALEEINRDAWEITDEDGEMLQIFLFKNDSKEKIEEIKKNQELQNKLIDFCEKIK